MPSVFDELPVDERRQIDRICTRFESLWKQGLSPCLEDHLHEVAGPVRAHLLRELLLIDLDYRQRGGDTGSPDDYALRFPEHAGLVAEVCHELSARPAAAGAGPLPVIPGYHVLRELGRGGMGTVYEAEQDTPHRSVALKVIRPGLASPQLLKRFTREAEILGRLHHPGIAQVFEAGLTADGQPFFAMEFILGEPLDSFARRQALDTRARLDLLARVCDAVQHAHEHGVIHRDLKPANILVDQAGQPRVLDFGVARLADADLQTTTARTVAGQLLGTPCYMSPEQVMAAPTTLDARSDVYTLGVILFELLADRLPYDLQHLPLPEVARVIREQDPARLSSVNALFRGDVETIVAKALAKDPAQRYASAGELAADVRRYLSHEPIRARPPSLPYRFRKFARRNKALVGGTAGILGALVLGLVGTTLFALRARDSARQAKDEERVARYQTYRARVAAASAALTVHDVMDAARQLAEAPKELRGWEWDYLHSRLDDSVVVIRLGEKEDVQLVHSSDGSRIAVFTDSRMTLLDLDGRELLSRPVPRAGILRYLDLRTNRGLTFVEDVDGALQLLDEEERVRMRLPGVPGMITGPMCLNADGSRLAVAWRNPKDWAILVYALTAAKPAVSRVNPGSFTWSLAFSPDNTCFASGGEDGIVRVWESASGKLLAACRGHRSKVISVAFRADGLRLVTASADGSVRQWDPATGREVEPPYEGHTGEVTTAAYSPDGAWVASGGTDRTVRVWGASDRQEVSVLHGYTGFVRDVAFTANGRQVISVSAYFGIFGIAYAGVGDNTVRIWEALPGAGLPVLRGHDKYVYPVAYSPDGRWIASGSWDHTLCLWDAHTGELCATLPHPGVVRALAFGPDSSWLVSAPDLAGHLQIWDVATGRRRQQIKAPGPIVVAIAVSPDGSRIAAVERAGTVSVVETASGREVAAWQIDGSWSEKKPLAYSSDGRWLACMGEDKDNIDIWDAQTHQRITQLVGHTRPVYFVAFSSDGRRLASGGNDRTVRVWDVATWECVAVLRGHTDEVFAAAFHPDGTRLASAGRDRAIWLWDLTTGQEVARLPGHTNYVFSLAFSPDGKSLVSGSGDGTVRLWDTAPLAERYRARREVEALRPNAERLVGRLFGEKKEPAEVVAAHRADAALSEPLRRAALQAALRRMQPPVEHGAQVSAIAPGPIARPGAAASRDEDDSGPCRTSTGSRAWRLRSKLLCICRNVTGTPRQESSSARMAARGQPPRMAQVVC
jgi:WD40 repeat protein/serine/threonine protein kinase